MEISGDLRGVNGPRGRKPAAGTERTDAGSGSGSRSRSDAAEVSGADAADVPRLVAILRNMRPIDEAKVAQLKAAIADGAYRADPEELADALLARAARQRPGT